MKEKETTLRLRESTKKKLNEIEFAKKGKSYDDILNELLDKYGRLAK
ncbi:hypothetical protein JXB27_01645 [Candidatus Woesearchaeota archaeon]|nr:hypothetical protein [Candidatus Woesearchaeota archaeon]